MSNKKTKLLIDAEMIMVGVKCVLVDLMAGAARNGWHYEESQAKRILEAMKVFTKESSDERRKK